MPYAPTRTPDVQLYYQDQGEGRPVVLIHGWPLSHRMWEPQMTALRDAGYRVIAYDRRGFGDSSKPSGDYSYDTLADDLDALLSHLDLHRATIVGFSMGGGEVVRYLAEHGSDRVEQAALISSIIPLVPQKSDNPDGVPQEDLENIMQALHDDRVSFLAQFGKNFFNYDDHKSDISEQTLHYHWSIAAMASHYATIATAEAWGGTDFRPELQQVTVPTLIVHGDADQIVPIETAGDQAAEGIPNNRYQVLSEAPHGLNYTHREQLNRLLIDFLKQ